MIGNKNSIAVLAAVITCLLWLSACGGGGGNQGLMSLEPGASGRQSELGPAPSADELRQVLEAELAALGKDPDRTAAKAPAGGFVFDLQGGAFDPDGSGPLGNAGIVLNWTEILEGDYDSNGEVGLTDLTPIAVNFGREVNYDNAQDHSGISWWPSGDPEDNLGNGTEVPPQENSGALNWRLSRVDGDRNGLINTSDVTTIAQHWGERISGYRVYRKGPGELEFKLLPDASDPQSPLSVSRSVAGPKAMSAVSAAFPVRYSFVDPEPTNEVFQYRVVPYDIDSQTEGSQSIEIQVDASLGTIGASLVQADFSTGISEGGIPLSVGFDASSSFAIGSEIVRYQWDFDGDGSIDLDAGSDPLAIFTYTENIRYNATLIVTSADGDTASAVRAVSVLGGNGNIPPTPHLEMTDNANDRRIPDSDNPTLQGLLPLSVHFDASSSSDFDGSIVNYAWDFDGDGVADFVDNLPTVDYTFTENSTFNVSVTIEDNDGGRASKQATVIVTNGAGNWPPSARISAVPVKGAPPLDVQFDGGLSFDPDGVIVRYEWDLNDDGTYERDTGASARISNVFNESKAYNVWLRVTDDSGATAIRRQLVIVNNAPFAALTANVTTGPAALEVQFDGSGSSDTDTNDLIVQHEWDFDGDGIYDTNTGTIAVARHTYFNVGSYSAGLRVTDRYGESTSTTLGITVLEPPSNILPVARIEAFPNTVTAGESVQLDATPSSDADGDIISWAWDFDGDQIFDQISYDSSLVNHTYGEAGSFEATVRVTDNLGGTAKASTLVTVLGVNGNQPPVASLVVTPAGGAPPIAVQFDATGSVDPDGTIASYEWDLDGDGSFEENSGTTGVNSRIYTTKGVYNVMVRITDDQGATAKKIVPVTVGTPPTAVLSTDIDSDSNPPERVTEDPSSVTLNASASFDADGLITDYAWDVDNNGIYEISTGVSPFLSVTFDLENVEFNTDTGLWEPRPRVIALGTSYYPEGIFPGVFPSVALMSVRVTDDINATGVATIPIVVEDRYDEIEDNDNYTQANHLEGTGASGVFSPNQVGGDSLSGVRRNYGSSFISGAEAISSLRGNLGFLDDNGQGYNGDDDDFYSFTLDDGGHVVIDLLFDGLNAGGADLNLRLIGSDGVSVLAESLSTNSNEHIEYDFRDGGTYYVRANRFLGARADYQLNLSVGPIQYYPDDAIDNDNGSQGTADPYVLVQQNNMSAAVGRLGGSDLRDWYSFDMVPNAQLDIRLLFTHKVGDLDMELRGPSGELLSYSSTVTDNEFISYTIPGGVSGTGYVKVEFNSGGETNYHLSIGYPPPVPTNLNATKGVNSTLVTVTWSPGTGGNSFDGYELFIADNPDGPYNLLERVGSFVTSYQLPTTESHPWWFKVRSYRNGNQAPSDFTDPQFGFSVNLRSATGVSASDGEDNRLITLRWNSPTSGPAPDEYLIQRSPQYNVNAWELLATVSGLDNEYVDDVGIPADGSSYLAKAYHYRVVSVKENYNLAYSSYDLGYPAVLDQPYGVNASDGSWNDRILVSWYYNGTHGEAPDGFKIYRRDEYTDQVVEAMDVSGGSTRSAMVQTNFAGTYYVKAYKQDYGLSPLSSGNYGFSKGLQPPADLYGVQVNTSNDYTFEVHWANPNEGPRPQYFQYQYYRASGGTNAGYSNTSGTSLTISSQPSAPPNGGTSDVTVRVKSVRSGASSNWATTTITLKNLNN
ncbi:MAG: PKD domain-containing protein [bacterium]